MDNKLKKVHIVGGDISYAGLFLDKIKLVGDISDANIVLFTGGEDVCPSFYGEDVGHLTYTNIDRDEREAAAFRTARKYNKLCIGICRGAQFCTVMSGGGLIQHVTGHAVNGTHKIHLLNEGVDIDITSTHHQMMWPFWLNKKDYSILAKATNDLSATYLGENNNEKNLPADFVESEIVYYKKTNSLCIQGHPEYMPKDSSAVKYINVLIREYLEDTIETTPRVIEEEVEVPNVDDGILRQINNVNVQRVELNDIDWEAARIRMNDQVGRVQQIEAQRPRRAFNAIWDVEAPDFH